MSAWIKVETFLLNVAALVMVLAIGAVLTLPLLIWLWILSKIVRG